MFTSRRNGHESNGGAFGLFDRQFRELDREARRRADGDEDAGSAAAVLHPTTLFGPTCDALDTISLAEQLPELEIGDYLYSENIGAYSAASSTHFNGFPPATVVHVNEMPAARTRAK